MTTRKTTKSARKPSGAKKATPARKRRATSKRAAKRKPGAKAGRSTAVTTAKGLRIRMYRVGFGDFFLVTVPTSSGDQYILIDCGVFKGTSGTGDIGSIVEAVEDMYKTTKGKLALVIMTHRHADHIAGFSKAFDRFKNDFTASMVWMPYWEQFNDPKDSGKAFALDSATDSAKAFGLDAANDDAFNLQLDIQALAENLGMQFRGREDDAAKEALAQLGNATGIEDFNAAATGKKKGGPNAKALELLKIHLGDNGKKVRYYAANDEPELPPELKGLTAAILGPPPKKAKAFMALTDLKKGVGQYLDSVKDGEDGPKALEPFPFEWFADEEREYESHNKDLEHPIDYKQVKTVVEDSQPDMLAAAAGKIETFLNNQSLVVLFEFGGKKLLFPGDAQAGNWEYWLYKMDGPIKDPTQAGEMVEASRELLQTIDFYKVGHHGSTNATPIQAVEAAVGRPKSSKGFVSMCSTEYGVFGKRENASEVPRDPLMTALSDGCSLIRSDSFPINVTAPKKMTIKPVKGVDTKLPKPKVGKLKKGNLYIEYSF
jgi:ribonuclease BN (tRNA processing enzyme)